ncbi:MAG: DUF177 domain-containing protein [Alphaproteobacteria bacterium]
MVSKAPPQPEFSRPFDTAELGEVAEHRVIEATEEECRALADRFGALGIDRLRAELTIAKLGPGLFRLEGRLSASVRQRCVVTLDPLESSIDERVSISYASGDGGGEEGVADDQGDDGPEALHGSVIDLGEAVSQHLALALDPYPRAPGASLDAVLPRSSETPEKSASPFAALAALRKRMG